MAIDLHFGSLRACSICLGLRAKGLAVQSIPACELGCSLLIHAYVGDVCTLGPNTSKLCRILARRILFDLPVCWSLFYQAPQN